MPTYEYECPGCGNNFDFFQKMTDDVLKTCPGCGNDGLRRLIGGGTGIIFKGSGFYVNDARKPETKPTAPSDSASAKTVADGGSKSKETPAKKD